ncbi:MAG: IPT/TIG domain-containing protein [Myxococcota bacterium]|nr:IPT/TIG domain-containing protein [Myxococcota bacterium]
MFRMVTLSILCLSTLATARTVLQNDSVEAGAQIAFYPNMRGGESFVSIFDVPAEYDNYKVCRILLWVGPAGFNIFTFRLAEATEDGDEAQLIWQSDLDAYQVSGSREQMSSVDLAAQRITTNARRLRIRGRHVEGSGAPPGIASDTDGITPGHNRLRVLQRNGSWFSDFTDVLEDGGSPERPPGDWVFRLEIAHLDEVCPNGEAQLPDMSRPRPPQDAGVVRDDSGPGDLDAGLPETDVGLSDAAGFDDNDTQTVGTDAVPEADGSPLPIVGLELTRINPERGTRDRNTEVVINGRGFLSNNDLFVELGDTRLLEVDVLSGSTLTAVVPAGLDEGRYDLRITRGDGQVALLPRAFTIVGDTLNVISVSPRMLAQNAPVDMSIQGRGFGENTQFSIGGIGIESLTFESDEVVRGTFVASLPVGTYDLVARNGDASARLLDAISIIKSGGAAGATDGGCSHIGGVPSQTLGVLLLIAICGLRRRRTP